MDLSQSQPGPAPCVAAFKSVKAGKNWFMFFVALAILVQLAGFVLVNWVDVIDELHRPSGLEAAATKPATQPAVEPEAVGAATMWKDILHWVFPAGKFLAFAGGALTVIALMLTLQLSMVGRLRGIASFTSAFLWSLILLAIVTPWQQVLGGSFAAGALYNLGELTEMTATVKPSWGPSGVQLLDQIIYYARFVAYPVLALLVWLAVMLKFADGYKESIVSPIGTVSENHPQEPKP